MTLIDTFAKMPNADLAALGLLIVAWLVAGWLSEHPPKWRLSVSVLMENYRHDWMRQFVTRTPRLFDVSLISSLRQGTTFFASASMIAIGGGAALIGNAAAVKELAADLPLDADQIDISLKILVPVFFMANALLKFIWAHRLFGYCAIIMAAVPNEPSDPLAYARAEQAAQINGTAAKSYNRGLRAIYFALTSLGWLFGPLALVVATILGTGVVLRREFWSQSREIIRRNCL